MRKSIERAWKYNQIVEIIYIDQQNRMTIRKVKILSLDTHSFQGYCFTRHAKRTFLVEQVLACIPVSPNEKSVVG